MTPQQSQHRPIEEKVEQWKIAFDEIYKHVRKTDDLALAHTSAQDTTLVVAIIHVAAELVH